MNYKDLILWQKAFKLSYLVYKLTDSFPKQEQFGLTSQIRRCAVSVPSNIAEGFGRVSKKYFHLFLKMSLGSLSELETQILLSEKIGYLKKDQTKEIDELLLEIQKIIGKIIKTSSSSTNPLTPKA